MCPPTAHAVLHALAWCCHACTRAASWLTPCVLAPLPHVPPRTPLHAGSCGYGYLWRDEPIGWDVAAATDFMEGYEEVCAHSGPPSTPPPPPMHGVFLACISSASAWLLVR
jgi:hypothetical protein